MGRVSSVSSNAAPHASPTVLVRIPGAMCAFPLDTVVETMRPLPVRALPGLPEFVRGVATVRGVPTPVIDPAPLFDAPQTSPSRMVVLRFGARRAAILVESVVGVVQIDPALVERLPPVLQNARSDAIEALGTLDSELLVTLRISRLVPESFWRSMTAGR